MADKPNPYDDKRRGIVDLDNTLHPERDPDARPRATRRVAATPSCFAEYAIVYNEEWPPRAIEYLQWSPSRIAVVTPWLNRAAVALNQMVGFVRGEAGYDKITPTVVLRYVVRHWRVFRSAARLRGYEAPVPEAIVILCKSYPNAMLDGLIGLCARVVQDDLDRRTRELRQLSVDSEEAEQRIAGQRRWIYEARNRLVGQVPWLDDDDFLEVISGERIGRRKLTMH